MEDELTKVTPQIEGRRFWWSGWYEQNTLGPRTANLAYDLFKYWNTRISAICMRQWPANMYSICFFFSWCFLLRWKTINSNILYSVIQLHTSKSGSYSLSMKLASKRVCMYCHTIQPDLCKRSIPRSCLGLDKPKYIQKSKQLNTPTYLEKWYIEPGKKDCAPSPWGRGLQTHESLFQI